MFWPDVLKTDRQGGGKASKTQFDLVPSGDMILQSDPDNEAAAEYAAWCEERAPTTWAGAGIKKPGRGRER
jgi:hypothetical protein